MNFSSQLMYGLGKSINDPCIKSLLNKLKGPCIDEKFETVHKLDFPGDGIEFTFDQDQRLVGVHFFADKLDGKVGYRSELPFSVKFSDCQIDVRRKFGTSPEASGGGNQWNGKEVPLWDRFKVGNALLHFQYSRIDLSVELVTLMLANVDGNHNA